MLEAVLQLFSGEERVILGGVLNTEGCELGA